MRIIENRCLLCPNTADFSKITSRLRDSDRHCVVRCGSCGHVQISPLPNPKEEKKFYDLNKQPKNIGVKIDIESLREKQRWDTERRANFASNWVRTGASILDIGSSYGFFLEEMKKRGYKSVGVEISKERRNISKKVTKAPVFDADLSEDFLNKNIGKYGMITISHVLEHILDPVKFCSVIKQHLKSGGGVIVEVPNLDDLMLKESGNYESFWWQRAHISYFDKNTLRRIFRKAGYKDIKVLGIQRYGIENMMNWMMFGKPQVDFPSFETKSQYKWLEKYYKSYLERKKICDTLIAIAKQ